MAIKHSLAMLFLLAIATNIFARDTAPTAHNAYDGIPPGGRALAMGNAFCAIEGDPAAIYFNPAGISSLQKQLVSFSVEATRQSQLTTNEIFGNEMLRNKNLVFIGLTSATGAFSWRPLADASFRTGTTTEWTQTETKINAYTLSATHKSSDKLHTGINISYLSGAIAQSGIQSGQPFANLASGNGTAIDFGAVYSVAPEFKIGAALSNVAGFVWWDDYETEQLPFGLRAGFAFQLSSFFTFASDWNRKYYRSSNGAQDTVHFGVEQCLGKILKLRAGTYGTDIDGKSESRVTFGIGYGNNGYSLSLSGEKYQVQAVDVFRYLFSLDLPI